MVKGRRSTSVSPTFIEDIVLTFKSLLARMDLLAMLYVTSTK